MDRLLNTIRQHDYYLLTEDFDSCAYRCLCTSHDHSWRRPIDIKALELVDEAYQNRTEWIKKSIRTTAKVRSLARFFLFMFGLSLTRTSSCAPADGQVQLGPRDHGLRAGVLEPRAHVRRLRSGYFVHVAAIRPSGDFGPQGEVRYRTLTLRFGRCVKVVLRKGAERGIRARAGRIGTYMCIIARFRTFMLCRYHR